MTGGQPGALPNLIVLGANKCGTSSLHYYLDLHPEIQMSSPKELNFFIAPEDSDAELFLADPEDRVLLGPAGNWSCGSDWYERHFSPETPVRGESSTLYTAPWNPGVAGRMAGLVPDARLIFVVRDPIARIASNYLHFHAEGRERRSLAAAVRRPIYVERTRYVSTLRPFLDRYPRDRILILRHDDLLRRRRETMSRVFGWLGVDPGFWSEKMRRERNVSGRMGLPFRILGRLRGTRLGDLGYRLPGEAKWLVERLNGSVGGKAKPEMDEDLRRTLLDELDPEIAELEEITGWDLAQWRARDPARAGA